MDSLLALTGPFGPDGPLALTGPAICWIATALALAGLVVAVFGVPRRLRAPCTGAVGAALVQAVAFLLCLVLVLAAIGAWMNREFVFYGTWGDLLGTSPDAVSAETFGGASDADGASDAGGASDANGESAASTLPTSPTELQALDAARTAAVPAALRAPLQDAELPGLADDDAGQDVTVTIPGPASGISRTAVVHLPPGYVSHPDRRYPVVLALHGIPGSPVVWEQAFHLGSLLDERATAGEIAPTIVVAPTAYPGRADTECVDAADGSALDETWLSQDVPAWIRAHLRTVEDPLAWATIGYSAGGWCASMLSVRHPELARASISLGGYFTPSYPKGKERTPVGDPRYDLPALVAQTHPPVAMYFFAGGKDPYAQPSLGDMQAAVAAPTSLEVRRDETGGHMILGWVEQTPDALAWLARTAPGFGVG